MGTAALGYPVERSSTVSRVTAGARLEHEPAFISPLNRPTANEELRMNEVANLTEPRKN